MALKHSALVSTHPEYFSRLVGCLFGERGIFKNLLRTVGHCVGIYKLLLAEKSEPGSSEEESNSVGSGLYLSRMRGHAGL